MGFRLQFGDEFVALTENWCLNCNEYVYALRIWGQIDPCYVYACTTCNERLMAVETTNSIKESIRAERQQYRDNEDVPIDFVFDFSDIEPEEGEQLTLFGGTQ